MLEKPNSFIKIGFEENISVGFVALGVKVDWYG